MSLRDHLRPHERQRYDFLQKRRTRLMRELAIYNVWARNLRAKLGRVRAELHQIDNRGRCRARYAELGKEDRYSRAGHSKSGATCG